MEEENNVIKIEATDAPVEEGKTSEVTLGNLYDINKELVEKYEKKLSPTKIREKKKIIRQYHEDTNNQYYMMLCRDRGDYTIFVSKEETDEPCFEDNIVECLQNRGDIKGIALTEDKQAIEVWISIEEESYCYYIFSYDNAIVDFHI